MLVSIYPTLAVLEYLGWVTKMALDTLGRPL